MLFNSYEFIFGFLPLILTGFFLLGTASRTWALRWLIAGSLGFYAWWRPLNVLIIAPSIIVNFLLARALQRLTSADRPRAAKAVLLAGIVFNVLFLGYFKYANFAVDTVNDVFGTGFLLHQIILPLGISFITFQKIAFLVDVHARRIESFSLQDYALFVLFFPQLVAGPIVHYREMMPQFHRASTRLDSGNLSVGVTLFLLGLFKKVVLADGIAPLVSPIYAAASGGSPVSLLPAWGAAVGFTVQMYFDFSGYSDMALGLGRMVGIRFPANFDSPLKASSIIEFWQRWHMTLTRFLTAYIYNPLALWLARRRLRKGLPPFAGKNRTVGGFLQLVMFPTVLTMFISGLWHGAGYLFILWGVVHGLYLTINQAWRILVPRWWPDRDRYQRVMGPLGVAITFIGVATAMVLFRSPTPSSAGLLLTGMIGGHGVSLPTTVMNHLGPLAGALHSIGVGTGLGVETDFLSLILWSAGLLAIALTCPNSLQLLARFEPALGYQAAPMTRLTRILSWQPSFTWAVPIAVITTLGIMRLSGLSEFLYWQF